MKATFRPPTTLTIGGGAALVEVGLPDRKILAGGLATHGGQFLFELLAVRGVLVVHDVFPFVGVKKNVIAFPEYSGAWGNPIAARYC